MSARTRGPWEIIRRRNTRHVTVIGPNEAYVCHVMPENAELVAAAPDLLSALREAREFIATEVERGKHVGWIDRQNTMLARIDALLSQADTREGE